jgi:hypothetical protein
MRLCSQMRVLALAPHAVMLADAGAPSVLAGAPDAVMLADAGAPAVLAALPPPFPCLRCLFPLLQRIVGLRCWRHGARVAHCEHQ